MTTDSHKKYMMYYKLWQEITGSVFLITLHFFILSIDIKYSGACMIHGEYAWLPQIYERDSFLSYVNSGIVFKVFAINKRRKSNM